jgi:hypothetical protein
MGYAMAIAACYGCKAAFSFNPLRVPSVIVDGKREPICEACVVIVNPIRVANGLEPIVPLPDAYDACDEDEL